MKKKRIGAPVPIGALSKLWKIMRLSVFFLLLFVAQTYAAVSYSQQTRLTFKMQNAKVIDVLSRIEDQSEFFFLFNQKLVDVERPVSVEVKNESVDKILTRIFENTNVSYQVKDRQIILTTATSSYTNEQQQKSVSGKVTDSSGASLPGVSVVVKGTTTGVITDMNGNYTLPKVSDNATLQFSFVGMKTLEIAVAGKNSVNATLIEESIGLEEVVAVGYGTQKKANLTGAIASINGDVMAKRPITNPSAMLQGLAPGVRVTQGLGQPGNESISIRIRGQGTFSGAGSDPLVLINGVPGSLTNLDPSMIENVTVLKDAASASIYGARAANGVVLVTTKQGNKSGKSTITYSGNYAQHSPTRMFDLVTNSVEYMKLANIARDNSSQSGSKYPQSEIDLYAQNVGNPEYPNFDWLDYMFNTAFVQTHNLSAAGTTDKVSYNVALNYVDQDGTLRGFNYKKYNFTYDVTAKINSFITIGAYSNIKHGNTMQTRQSQDDALLSSLSQAPTYMPWLPDDGTGVVRYTNAAYTFEAHNKNMPAIIATGTIKPNKDFDFNNQVWMSVKLAKGLEWYTKGAGRLYSNRTFDWRGAPTPIYMYHTKAENGQLDKGGVGMSDTQDRTFYTNFYSYLQYDYKTENKAHNFKLMAGYNQENELYNSLTAYRQDYPFVLQTIDAGGTTGWTNGGAETEWALQSLFGRLNYNFRDRYMFEANARYDGTSRISEDYRWGVFPSFSAGWRITEENFMKNAGIAWLNNLKLRGSWGQLGNQNVNARMNNLDQPYPYQAMISKVSTYPFDKKNESLAYTQTAYANNNIKWETTTSTDIGLEFTVFNRLSGTLEWYNKVTSDILRGSQVSALLGLSAPTVNQGEMKNKGIELSLNWNDVLRGGALNGLQYNIGLNFDRTRNELTKFGAREISGYYLYEEGIPYGQYYMLQCIGVFADQNEINNSPKQFSDTTLPGDLKYKDISGPNGKPDGIIDNNDRVITGGKFPGFEYSVVANANWKGFDISVIGSGVQDKKYFITDWGIIPFRQGSSPTRDYLAGMWTPENPNGAENPKLYWNDLGGAKNNRANTWFLRDASYFRLRNVTLGYTLPSRLTEKVKMSKCRLYLSGDNLVTITKFNGLDPERSGDGRAAQYPQNKIFSLGVNVEF